MPLLSSSAGLSARSLGLTSGVIAGAPTIDSINETGNNTVGQTLLVNITPGRPGSSPVTNYQYSVNNGSTWTSFSPAQTSTQLTISSLTNGTTYQVRIRSLQGNQTSEQSNMVSARPVALPGAPTISGITNDANGTTGSHISVAFSAGSAGTDATANYQYSLDNGTTWVSPSPVVTTSPLLITGLTNGTTYSVRLRALTSNSHNSSSSSAVSGRPIALPAAPTISSITASTGQVSIAFTPGTQGTDAISTYQYSLNNGSTWTNRSSGTTSSPIVVTGITDSTVASGGYTVRIRAVTNQSHISAQSNAVVPAATPAAAPVITSTSKTPTSITVNFTSAVAGSYAIDRHETSLDGTNWSTYTSGTAITGLSTSTAYTIRIRAVDVQSVNGAEASTAVTTDAEVAPNAPTIGVTEETSTTSITVNYTRGNAGTYAINSDERQVVYVLNGNTVIHNDWAAATSPITVTGLPYPDYFYTVRVRSKSTTGLAGAYSEVSVKTKASTPSAPGLSFSVESASERATASLSWTAPTYATKYHVYMNGAYQKEVTTTTTTIAVSAGSTYNFVVYAGNRHGDFSGASNTKTMNTGHYLLPWSWSGEQGERFIMKTASPPAGCDPYRFRITVSGSSSDPATAGYVEINSLTAQFVSGRKPAVGTTDYAAGQTFDRVALSNRSNLRWEYALTSVNDFGVNFGSTYSSRTHSTGVVRPHDWGGSLSFAIGAVDGKAFFSNCTISTSGDYWLAKEFVAYGKITTSTTYS